MRTYSRYLNSHQISLLLVVLILVVTASAITFLSLNTESAIKENVQNKLISIANLTSSQIDGDSLGSLKPGDENTSNFILIRDYLHKLKESDPDIAYIYTMRKNGDSVEFIVDGDNGLTSEPFAIGEPYSEYDPYLIAGFTAPTADTEFTTDQWGTFLSGFAPVKNSSGDVVGIVGVDMNSTVVKNKLNYLNFSYYLFGLIVLILSGLGLIINERRRILDEQKIKDSEKKYRFLFEEAGDAIFLINAEEKNFGTIEAANRAAAKMYGYSPEELQDMNIINLSSPESKNQSIDALNEISQDKPVSGEFMLIKKDGTTFPVEISAGVLNLISKKHIICISRDISERKLAETAIKTVNKKLSVLNFVTFNDIHNAILALQGYIVLTKSISDDESLAGLIGTEENLVMRIIHSLNFARCYQAMGMKPPEWQNVKLVFIFAISHMDLSSITRLINIDDLEIYCDHLLEQVFVSLAENILRHGEKVTKLTIEYKETNEGLILTFEDNGTGIPVNMKETIFERGFGSQKGMSLFLVREILGITGITIKEVGTFGEGARFEIIVPKIAYRFNQGNNIPI